jgi:hypothetical protein
MQTVSLVSSRPARPGYRDNAPGTQDSKLHVVANVTHVAVLHCSNRWVRGVGEGD